MRTKRGEGILVVRTSSSDEGIRNLHLLKKGITLRTNPLPFCAIFLRKKSYNIPPFFSAHPSIKGIILPLRPSFRVRPVCAAPPPVTSPQAQEATKQSGPPFVSDGRADEKAPLLFFCSSTVKRGKGFFERPCLLFLSPRPRSICPGKSSHGEKGVGEKGKKNVSPQPRALPLPTRTGSRLENCSALPPLGVSSLSLKPFPPPPPLLLVIKNKQKEGEARTFLILFFASGRKGERAAERVLAPLVFLPPLLFPRAKIP